MRPISLLLIMLAASLSACGGGGDASSTRPSPPPPPPPPAPVTPVPTTLVVSAGADQTVEPLSLLATRPVFLVRDASGQAMTGVDVSFAVDSGGGMLDGPTTARTGADGSVAAPPWRAGEREGVQVLLARVGSTLSARVRATARFATVSITPIAVPTAGGTIRFARAGLPLDGFAVQLPRDAFSTNATTLGLALESAAGLPLPEGSVARSPAVRLVPTGGTQRKAVAATFPLTDADTGIVVVVGRPVGTTGWRVLPTLGASRTALTVSVPVELAPPATNALRGLVAQVDPAPVKPSIDIMLLLRLDRRLLAGDFRTEFIPGADEWRMLPLQTYGASEPLTPDVLLYQQLLVAPAYTAVHYFINERTRNI